MTEPNRRWIFMVDDFDGQKHLDALGNEIDETDAKQDPFEGTDLESYSEGERRTDLWEERTGKWAERITRMSLGTIKAEDTTTMSEERCYVCKEPVDKCRCGNCIPCKIEAAGIERCSEVFHAESSIGEQISVPCKTVTITMTTQGPLPPRIQIVDADGFAALVADRKRLTDTLHRVDDLLANDFITAKNGDYRTALMEWLRRNIEIHDDPTVSEAARDREEYRRGLEAVILAIKESCGMGPDATNELMAAVIGDALRRKNASIEAMVKDRDEAFDAIKAAVGFGPEKPQNIMGGIKILADKAKMFDDALRRAVAHENLYQQALTMLAEGLTGQVGMNALMREVAALKTEVVKWQESSRCAGEKWEEARLVVDKLESELIEALKQNATQHGEQP